MGYVIYEKETTLLLTRREFKTAAAAKAAITRHLKKNFSAADVVACNLDWKYAIAESDVFYASIEKRVARENMMSGNTYYEGINTPNYCSPASEAYWSM